MPIRYQIIKEKRMVVCTASGVVTQDDVIDCQQGMGNDPDFDCSFSQLVDCTAITQAAITPSQMRSLAGRRSAFSSVSRRAMVARTPHGFALSRVFETVRGLQGDVNFRVFRDRVEALAWLRSEKDDPDVWTRLREASVGFSGGDDREGKNHAGQL